VLRLGSVILATVLLGVPRALDSRSFGAQRSVYLDVAPELPELSDFLEELERAIGAAAVTLAERPTEATTVIEIQKVARAEDPHGDRMEAVTLVVREGASAHPLILYYAPPDRSRAASRLVETLSA
jgi:hypothetical protein